MAIDFLRRFFAGRRPSLDAIPTTESSVAPLAETSGAVPEAPAPIIDFPPEPQIPSLPLDFVLTTEFNLRMNLDDYIVPSVGDYLMKTFYQTRFARESAIGERRMRFSFPGIEHVAGTPFSFVYHDMVYTGLITGIMPTDYDDDLLLPTNSPTRNVKGDFYIGVKFPGDYKWNDRLRRKLNRDIEHMFSYARLCSLANSGPKKRNPISWHAVPDNFRVYVLPGHQENPSSCPAPSRNGPLRRG